MLELLGIHCLTPKFPGKITIDRWQSNVLSKYSNQKETIQKYVNILPITNEILSISLVELYQEVTVILDNWKNSSSQQILNI
jgi:hypothetical protein